MVPAGLMRGVGIFSVLQNTGSDLRSSNHQRSCQGRGDRCGRQHRPQQGTFLGGAAGALCPRCPGGCTGCGPGALGRSGQRLCVHRLRRPLRGGGAAIARPGLEAMLAAPSASTDFALAVKHACGNASLPEAAVRLCNQAAIMSLALSTLPCPPREPGRGAAPRFGASLFELSRTFQGRATPGVQESRAGRSGTSGAWNCRRDGNSAVGRMRRRAQRISDAVKALAATGPVLDAVLSALGHAACLAEALRAACAKGYTRILQQLLRCRRLMVALLPRAPAAELPAGSRACDLARIVRDACSPRAGGKPRRDDPAVLLLRGAAFAVSRQWRDRWRRHSQPAE